MMLAVSLGVATGPVPHAAGQEPIDGPHDPCTFADVLASVGLDSEARRAYIATLRRNPDEDCAREGLLSVAPDAAPQPAAVCDRADALIDGRQLEAARELLTAEVSEGKKESACAAERLAELNSLGGRAREWATANLLDALAWPIAILALVALIALSSRLVASLLPMWPRPRLAFDAFGEASGETSAATLRALTIAAFERERMATSDSPPLDHVDQRQQTASFADDLERISDRLKPFAGLIRLLERWQGRRELTVTGQLHAAGDNGYGITTGITNNNRLEATDTLWLGVAPPTADTDVQRLAAPAGAWVIFQVARVASPDSSSLQTLSAVSFAWTRAGHDALAAGDQDWALKCYGRGRLADPSHREALVSEALLFASTTTNYTAAIFLLDTLIEQLEQEDD